MEEHNSYSDVTPEIVRLAELSKEAGVIDTELYTGTSAWDCRIQK